MNKKLEKLAEKLEAEQARKEKVKKLTTDERLTRIERLLKIDE